MKLQNLMEETVLLTMDEILGSMKDACKCNVCRYDIAAIALNNLKPKYAVTEEGYLYVKVENTKQQSHSDIITEITKAIEIVSKNPRHK